MAWEAHLAEPAAVAIYSSLDVTKQEFIIAYTLVLTFNMEIFHWSMMVGEDDCRGLKDVKRWNASQYLGVYHGSDNPLCYTVIHYKRFRIPAEFTIIVPSTQAVGREARGAPEDQTVQAWHRNRWQKPRDFNSEDRSKTWILLDGTSLKSEICAKTMESKQKNMAFHQTSVGIS